MSSAEDNLSGVSVQQFYSHTSQVFCVTLTHTETGCWAQSTDILSYENAKIAASNKLREQLQKYFAKQNADALAEQSVVIYVLWIGDSGTILNQHNAEEVLNALGDNPNKMLNASVKKYVEVKND